jgi:hypothetical protein
MVALRGRIMRAGDATSREATSGIATVPVASLNGSFLGQRRKSGRDARDPKLHRFNRPRIFSYCRNAIAVLVVTRRVGAKRRSGAAA